MTGDKTWVYYYEAPSNPEVKVWIFEDEEQPKMVKKKLNVKKVMFAIFFRSTASRCEAKYLSQLV
jgi:hypothetical protein